MHSGRFITFEGGEGTGKSTLQTALAPKLAAAGIEVICTRDPGGTPLGETVRELALHPPEGEVWSPLAETLLMYTARQDHLVKLIRPALDQGVWVLCDRFADSTRAYQTVGGGVAAEFVEALDRTIVAATQPDLTLVLDAAPVDVHVRRQGRGKEDVFEARGLSFHTRIREAFLEIARKHADRCVVVDANAPADTVRHKAWEIIDQRFALAGASG